VWKLTEKEMNMHLAESHNGACAKAVAKKCAPFGPGFSEDVAEKTERLEVWGSSFSDPGPDFCVFKAFDSAGTAVAEIRCAGY
jgi:hypothetical protein